jgi:hypothetical protein
MEDMQARREDVESIAGIVKAIYEVISGPAGARDWDRERTLMHPGVRLMPTRRGPDGSPTVEILDTEGFIASRTPFFAANDFYEVETGQRVERFGDIAQVWSAYEGRRAPDGEVLFRGVNSIQLFHDGDRWWVMSVLWSNGSEGNPLLASLVGS